MSQDSMGNYQKADEIAFYFMSCCEDKTRAEKTDMIKEALDSKDTFYKAEIERLQIYSEYPFGCDNKEHMADEIIRLKKESMPLDNIYKNRMKKENLELRETLTLYKSKLGEVQEVANKFFSVDREQTCMGYLGKNPNWYKVNVTAYDEFEKALQTITELLGEK